MNSDLLIRWLTACLLLPCLLLTAGRPQAASLQLPELGSRQQEALDQQTEDTFRNAFLSRLYTQHSVIEDPLVQLWLHRLGQSLAVHAPLQPRPMQTLPIKSDTINAFAGPGGVIGINSGLILAAHSKDEVAAVIAHEIGHVTQHHLLRRFSRVGQENLTAFATFIAALLVGQLDPQAGMATFYAGNALNLEQQLKYSRHHETEADAVGIQLLAESGYDPTVMARFFQTLQRRSLNDPSQVPEVLRTHPVTPHRIAAAENRAQRLHKTAQDTPLPLPALKNLQALLSPHPAQPSCLAKAQAGKALCKTCLHQLQKMAQEDWLVMGTLLKWAETHAPLLLPQLQRRVTTRYPDNPALQLILARIAFHQHDTKQAYAHLSQIRQSAPAGIRAQAFELQARLLQGEHRADSSLLMQAQAAVLKGEIKKARHLIKQIDPARFSAAERVQLKTLLQAYPTVADSNSNTPSPKARYRPMHHAGSASP